MGQRNSKTALMGLDIKGPTYFSIHLELIYFVKKSNNNSVSGVFSQFHVGQRASLACGLLPWIRESENRGDSADRCEGFNFQLPKEFLDTHDTHNNTCQMVTGFIFPKYREMHGLIHTQELKKRIVMYKILTREIRSTLERETILKKHPS